MRCVVNRNNHHNPHYLGSAPTNEHIRCIITQPMNSWKRFHITTLLPTRTARGYSRLRPGETAVRQFEVHLLHALGNDREVELLHCALPSFAAETSSADRVPQQ